MDHFDLAHRTIAFFPSEEDYNGPFDYDSIPKAVGTSSGPVERRQHSDSDSDLEALALDRLDSLEMLLMLELHGIAVEAETVELLSSVS